MECFKRNFNCFLIPFVRPRNSGVWYVVCCDEFRLFLIGVEMRDEMR